GLILAMAETAEGHGCDSVWVGDSLTAKPRLEALGVLSAVAARTSRVRLGTAVLLAALRHPVLLAQTVATLDIISGGRTVLGVGVGGAFTPEMRQEWLAATVPPSQRAGRLEETLTLLRRLWTEPAVTFHGRHFHLDDVALEPKPAQRSGVPILIACHQRAGVEAQFRRVAALGDGYISITDSPQQYAETARAVKRYALEEGREFRTMEAVFYMTVNLHADKDRAEDEANAYLLQYYGVNHWGDRWGPFGPPSAVVAAMKSYVAAGAGTIILRFASFDPLSQLSAFAREVMPAFAAE
ncbi:MAG: LLM class flavin-dependent oxidoreductase, partial [Dehalococcoidia bacterium]